MAFGVDDAIAGASALSGLFGKHSDPFARQKRAYMDNQLAYQKRMQQLAINYDPRIEDAKAVRFATDQTSRALTNASRKLNQDFKNQGGSPTGDTNFSVGIQRASDDIQSPLSSWLADRASSQTMRKEQMLASAIGASPGSVMDAYDQMRSQPAYPQDSQMLLTQVLEHALNKGGGKSGGSKAVGGFKKRGASFTMDPQAGALNA